MAYCLLKGFAKHHTSVNIPEKQRKQWPRLHLSVFSSGFSERDNSKESRPALKERVGPQWQLFKQAQIPVSSSWCGSVLSSDVWGLVVTLVGKQVCSWSWHLATSFLFTPTIPDWVPWVHSACANWRRAAAQTSSFPIPLRRLEETDVANLIRAQGKSSIQFMTE